MLSAITVPMGPSHPVVSHPLAVIFMDLSSLFCKYESASGPMLPSSPPTAADDPFCDNVIARPRYLSTFTFPSELVPVSPG